MLKQILSGVMAAAMCCMLAACVPKQTEVLENKGQFSTLTVAVRSGEQNNFQNVVTKFENENPDIKIKLTELGSDLEQYRLVTAAFSSEEYLFDIVEIEDVWVDDFVDKGYIVPLTKTISESDGYIPIVRESFIRDEKLYAMPFQMDLGMLFSLKKFEWNGDFASLVQNTVQENEQLRAINSEREEVLCGLMELIEYSGGDIQRALGLYRDIYHGKGNERLGIEEFRKKEVPVMRSWASVLPLLRSETSGVAGEFNAHNMPKNDEGDEISTAKLYALAVSKLSDKKEACERFIEYSGKNEAQIDLIKKTGTYPIKPELYNNPSINSQWTHITVMKDRVEEVQLRPHMTGYMEKANNLQTCLSEYMNGQLDAETAEARVREFLGK